MRIRVFVRPFIHITHNHKSCLSVSTSSTCRPTIESCFDGTRIFRIDWEEDRQSIPRTHENEEENDVLLVRLFDVSTRSDERISDHCMPAQGLNGLWSRLLEGSCRPHH